MKLKKKIVVKEVPLPEAKFGDCTKEGDAYTIRISPLHRNERSRMNTTIHEALHAGNWDLSEKTIQHLTACVVKVLWGEGYRRHKSK